MTYWFSSDPHYNHKNIIEYSKRPYSSVEEMNEALIQNWNSVVKPEDTAWLMGDIGLGGEPSLIKSILLRLNGHKNLVLGNHDMIVRKNGLLNLFENAASLHTDKYIYNIQEIIVNDPEDGHKQPIVMCHFPLESWHHMHHGTWHLHGHCHGTLPSKEYQKRLDVGVDVHNYAPISYEQIKEHMKKKVFKPVDHHM